MTNSLSVLTLNARIQTRLDGKHQFVYRKAHILQYLSDEMPDLVGWQELKRPMLEGLATGMPDYRFIGCAAEANGRGQFNAIAYRPGRLTLEASGTFWLSDTPDEPGSRFFPQSFDARTCTWASFRRRKDGMRFRYFNTHMDHLSRSARLKGTFVTLCRIEKIQALEPLPFFLGGDFNFSPRSKAYAACLAWRFQQGGALVDLTRGIETSFHWYGALRLPYKIDYLFTDEATSRRAEFHTTAVQTDSLGRFLSDHYGILMKCSL